MEFVNSSEGFLFESPTVQHLPTLNTVVTALTFAT